MTSRTVPIMLQGLRKRLASMSVALCAWRRWFRQSPCRLMINMNQILPLFVFYSPLSIQVIFTVSSVPLFPALGRGPTQQWWPPKSRMSVCSASRFHFFSYKHGNSSHGESDGASGQPKPWHPDTWYSWVLSHIHLATHPILFLFLLHFAYSLPWSPLYLDYLQANLHHQKFNTQKPSSKISSDNGNDNYCSLFCILCYHFQSPFTWVILFAHCWFSWIHSSHSFLP